MTRPATPGGRPEAEGGTRFDAEIDQALRAERRLFFKALAALALVIVVVVVRSLFFA
jgi:hypothetical protein